MKNNVLFLGCLMFVQVIALSQTGPGGVENSATVQGFWFGAGDISAAPANGDDVSTWNDLFVGGTNHDATDPGSSAPSFQTNIINGFPALFFDGTEELAISTETNVNTNGPFTAKTYFIVFRTGNSVNTTQVLYEQGGNSRGMAMYINGSDNNLYLGMWDNNPANNTWYVNFPVSTNQNYLVMLRYDGLAGTVEGFMNGSATTITTNGSASVPASLNNHGGDIGLGSVNGNMRDASFTSLTDNDFTGYIAEFIHFNKAVNAAEEKIIKNYLSARYAVNILSDDGYTGDDNGNGDFDYDVIGIGQESGGSHSDSESSAGLNISEFNASLGNGDLVLTGNDNAATQQTTSNVTGSVQARWYSSWYVEKTGTVDLKLSFDFGDAGAMVTPTSPGTDYVLLYRATNSGNFTEVSFANRGLENTDQIFFEVTNANLATGYYTIGTTNASGSPVASGSPQTWYSYKSGDWSDPTTWTLDGSIVPLFTNPSGQVPAINDMVVITPGRTVTVDIDNIAIQNMEVIGNLDVGITANHDFNTITGSGRIKISGNNPGSGVVDNFPAGDATGFIDPASGGTVEINGTGVTLDQSRTFRNVIVNMTSASDVAVLINNYTINGSLTVENGILQINDNASTNVLNLDVKENVTIERNGQITVGSGNTIGTYDIAASGEGDSNLPPVGSYHSIYHQFYIGGNLNNQGIARFTNQTNPDYNDFYTGGAANVFFTGAQDNTVTLNGQTDFYNLIINKGVDQTYALEINSSNNANFRLFGPNVLVHQTGSPFSSSNPEVRKPLWIQNGTLKLTGNIFIPTLAEGVGFNFSFTNDLIIPQNGALWLAGDNVTVHSTALTSDAEVAGHDGVENNYWGQGLAVYGKLRVSAGTLDTRNSWEGLIFYPGVSAPEIIIEGGTVTSGWLRDQFSSGQASYTQTGGVFNVTGGNSSPPGSARFGISSPEMIFNMSGGTINLGGNSRPITFIVNSDPGNYNVTGGRIVFNMDADGGSLTSTANLWDVDINSTSGSRTLTLATDLQASNDLKIGSNATLDVDNTNDFNVTIGGDFTVENGGTYNHYDNTTTFDGTKDSNLIFNNTITTQTLNNLTINKVEAGDEQVRIAAGATVALQVDGELRLENGTLNYQTFTVNAKANVYVADTLGETASTGKLLLDAAVAQTITSENGIIGNLELDNNNGVNLANNDLSISNTLTLTNGIFDINTHQLTLSGASANIAGSGFGTTKMIRTDGNASDGGLKLYLDANETLTFPIGTDANGNTRYTPITGTFSSFSDDGYIQISLADEVLPTSNASGGSILSFYWRVIHHDFATVPKVTSYVFSGDETDDGTNPTNAFPNIWRPGKILNESPFTRSTEAGANISGHDITFNGDGTPFDLENASYTAGEEDRFAGAPDVFYNNDNAVRNWNNPSTWSTDTHNGTNPGSIIPGAGDVVYISNPNGNSNTNHYVIGNVNFEVGAIIFDKPGGGWGPRLILQRDRTYNLGLVGGSSGQIGIDLDNTSSRNPDISGDLGDFNTEPTNQVIFFPKDNNSTTPHEVPSNLTEFPGVRIHGSGNSTYRIVTFTEDAVINNDLRIDVSSQLRLNDGATGNITIRDDLYIADDAYGGKLIFQNSGTARTVTIEGDLRIEGSSNGGGTSSLEVETGGSANLAHRITLAGNFSMENGNRTSVDLFTNNSGESNVILELTGETNSGLIAETSVTSVVPELYRVVVNKGIDQTYSFSFDEDFSLNGSTNGTTKAVELQNGTLIINNTAINADLTTGGDDFPIPSTAALEVTQGTVNVSGSNTGILLDGLLKINGGTVDMDDGVGNGNNYIEYTSTGNAILEISAGSLVVGSQVRRNTTFSSGVLKYRQSGGTVVIGKNAAFENDRGMLEILNNGSEFTHTAGDLTIVRQNTGSPIAAALILDPTTSSVSGPSAIYIGNSDTPSGQNDLGINSAIALNNLTIDGTNNPIAKLSIRPLTVGGVLTVNTNATLDGNGLDLTLSGDFVNDGTYTPNGNTTLFNSSGSQSFSGSGTADFYDFTKIATGTLNISKAITINNDLHLSMGTLADNGNTINVLGDVTNDATHTSSGGNGITFSGSTSQTLARSTSGTGIFGVLTIDNANGVIIQDGNGYHFSINDNLRLSSGVFGIGGSLLTLDTDASITPVNPFGITNMIQTNSSFTDNGVKKEFAAGITADFTFPVGESKFTPVTFNFSDPGHTTGSSAGSIIVRPANEPHPSINDGVDWTFPSDLDNVLQYYWILNAQTFSNDFVADVVFSYDESDVETDDPSYTESDYLTARILSENNPSASINKFSTADVNTVANTLTFNFNGVDNTGISGDYFAGVDQAIPPSVPIYTTDATGNVGDDIYDLDNPGGVPSGAILVVDNQTVTFNVNGVNLYQTQIINNGELIVNETDAHRLGEVSGTGTLRLVSNSSSVVVPAGNYDDFFSCTGGTLAYDGTGSYEIMSGLNQIRNLVLSGTGTKTLANNDIVVCNDLTLSGPVFDNTNNRNITIQNDLVLNSGTFKSGVSNTLAVSGNVTLSGGNFNGESGGTSAVDGNLTINSGTFDVGNGGEVIVLGNITKAGGTFNGGASSAKLVLQGSSNQTIAGSFVGVNQMHKIEVDNASGVTLAGDVDVNDELLLTNGLITPGSNKLKINADAVISPATGKSNAYVNGPLSKEINLNASFTFPVGKDGRWGYASVEEANTGGTEWTVAYFSNSADNEASISNLVPAVSTPQIMTISSNEYWKISDNPSGASAKVGLRWDGQSDVSEELIERETLEVMVWNATNSNWDNFGGENFSAGHTQSNGFFSAINQISFSEKFVTLGSQDDANTLPVELINFDANLKDGKVYLDWKTASEINNDFFEVQRSEDGKDWPVIGEVTGNGTINEVVSYGFIDKSPLFGQSYYRLRQVDFDGQFEYSPTVSINNSFEGQRMEVILFPNPTSQGNINLRVISQNKENTIHISMVNISGERFYDKTHWASDFSQDKKITIPGRLKPGIYVLIVKQNDQVFRAKLIIR